MRWIRRLRPLLEGSLASQRLPRRPRAADRRHYRPAVECLEGRWLLATYLVTNTNDSGPGSLRQAIFDANANPGADVINFNIAPGGVQTITPNRDLDIITDPVVIDGTTQPGFAGTPLIELNGSNINNPALWIAGDCTVRGLIINRTHGPGIQLDGNNNIVAGNFLGTDTLGTVTTGFGNASGVQVNGNNNTIGGTTAGDRNVISGNQFGGVRISGAGPGQGAGNVVHGNYIGIDVNGTQPLGNGEVGILIFNGASNNTIGGTAAGTGNVISANHGVGVGFSATGTNGNVVQGNFIGTNAAGTAALGNDQDGVSILQAASNNLIGGAVAGARNVISGNGGFGVRIDDANTAGNVVQGNYLGTDVLGMVALGNGMDGVVVGSYTGAANTIGGTAAGAGNLISGNQGNAGITLFGTNPAGTVV
jgi:hypothetical protein